MKLLLASNSPRRKELLKALGFEFEIIKINCEEIFPQDLPAENVAEFLAVLKSNSHAKLQNEELLLTADTTVVVDEEILGKPTSVEEARNMLETLSGRAHQVYTGIALRSRNEIYSATDVATVHFAPLTQEEIENYISEAKPFDKAGSYGIQDWIGMAKVTKIEGSYYTIMGLPTHLVYEALSKFS